MVELLAVVRKKERVFYRDYCENFFVLFCVIFAWFSIERKEKDWRGNGWNRKESCL